MARHGAIQERLKKVQKDLDVEHQEWVKAGLPDPGSMWRMNDSEFQHHCHTEAFFRILTKHLGVPEEVCNLYYKEVILEELQHFRAAATEMRAEAIRNSIVDGIDIFKPRPEI